MRPVLAVGPDGDVAGLVRSIGAGRVLARQDVDGIGNAILELYREWLATGKTEYRGDLEMTERQSRRERARDLAGVLDEVLKERHGA